MNKKIVEVKDISYLIEGTEVLANVSFDIFDKEILFIIGPNGAGKSTLLQIILGLLKQTSGAVKIESRVNSPDVVSKSCGYVSQYFSMDRTFPISVSEVVDLNADNPDIQNKIVNALRQVDAENLYDKKIGDLSGGELQKVLIARALASEPKLLFLDEPTNNLDINAQQNLFSLLTRLKVEKDMGIIVVSHDINVVSENADKVLCLNRTIGCTGVPTKVLTKEILESVYGRSLAFYGHR